jgi:hypothetical protein
MPSFSKKPPDQVNDASNDPDAENADHDEFDSLRHDQLPFLPLCIVESP